MDWNARYSAPGYLFGTEPAAFLRTQAERIPRGARVLCVAEGEGRNAVYLASLGHPVIAFEPSEVAREKARRLADEKGVEVDWRDADVESWDWSLPFDAVVAVFVQFAPPALRTRLFAGLDEALRPGGILLLHGYAPRQVDYGTGGPPDRANMYEIPMLEEAFEGFEIELARDYDAEIEEGPGHSGRSALIDFVARKPDAF